CEQIYTATRERERRLERMRMADISISFYDAEMRLQHVVRNEYGIDLLQPANDTGTIAIPLPFDSPVGEWLWDEKARLDRGEKKNINAVIEYCGSRIGSLVEHIDLELDED